MEAINRPVGKDGYNVLLMPTYKQSLDRLNYTDNLMPLLLLIEHRNKQ